MKIVDNLKKIVNDFYKTNNSTSSIGNQFLRQGHSRPMVQDWSSVIISDKDIYSGYPYGIINKRANKVAQLATNYLMTTVNKQTVEEDVDKIIIHPYLDVINTSPTFSNFKFWHNISAFLDLEGVYYLMAVRNYSKSNGKFGDIQEFEMLNPYNIRRVVNSKTLEVGGYIEQRGGMTREIAPEMVIEIKDFNPFSETDSFSMTDALGNAQFTLKQANDYTRHSLKNNLASPGAISTDVILEDQQFANFVNRITNQEKGTPLFGNGAGAINWDPMQIEMDKAALDKITDINRNELFAVSGVGKTNLAIEESGTTRETAKVQKDLLTEDHIIPRLQLIIDALNQDYKNNYSKEYEKTECTLYIDNPLKVDKDNDLKDLQIREQTITLYDNMIKLGYSSGITSKFINGEITVVDLGEPEMPRVQPVEESDNKPKEDTKDVSDKPENNENGVYLSQKSYDFILSAIDEKIKLVDNKLEHINKTIDHNINNDSVDVLVKPASKEALNNFLPIIKNEFSEESRGIITTQQGVLQNSIIDIQTRLTSTALNNINNLENDFSSESDIITDKEYETIRRELVVILAAFYLIIIPLYGKTIVNRRLLEFGESTDFKLDDDIKERINELSEQVASSHVATVSSDLYNTVQSSFDNIVSEQLDKIKTGGRSITDDDLVMARKSALNGSSKQRIISELKNKYNDITTNRAKAISRTETNRAFNQAQYQADLQFIQQNGYDSKAYKKWITRSGNPCPTCIDLASRPPIPFTKNFADLGDKIITTYEENGKTKVKTQMVDFEPLSAGNAHVNCGCTYQLIIENNVLNNFEKDENSGNLYRDSSSGRFTTGPSGKNSEYSDMNMSSQEFAQYIDSLKSVNVDDIKKQTENYQGVEAYQVNKFLQKTKGKTSTNRDFVSDFKPSEVSGDYVDRVGGPRKKIVDSFDKSMVHKIQSNTTSNGKGNPYRAGDGKYTTGPGSGGHQVSEEEFENILFNNLNGYEPGDKDEQLTALAKINGYDAKPKNIDSDEFMVMEKSGKENVLYRGFTPGEKTSEYMKQLREGEYWAGTGHEGAGIYTTGKLSIAKDGYAGYNLDNVQTMILKNDAKIANYEGEYNSFVKFTENKVSKYMDLSEQAWSAGKDSDAEKYDILVDKYSALDYGVYLAYKGFDAVHYKPTPDEPRDITVVYNRGKLIVPKEQ